MEKSKKQTKNRIIFFILFIAIASYILPRNLGNLDELWIYNSAKNVADGLIPYRDFNLVTTPFLPLLVGNILAILGNELLIMRVLAILLGTMILAVIEKILEKMKINQFLVYIAILAILVLLKDQFCIDYNFVNLLIILCIIYLEIKKFEKNENKIKVLFRFDFLIGLLAGLSIGFKQTTGVGLFMIALLNLILIIENKEEWKEYVKILGIRLLGASIPIGMLILYLTIHQLWPCFIDYCILGVKEFTNVILYSNLWKNSNLMIKGLSIVLPIILVYMYYITVVKKSKAEQQQKLFYVFCYSVASCIVIFPISDEVHFLIGMLPSAIGMVYAIHCLINWIEKKILKEKINIFFKEFIKCGLIVSIVLFSFNNVIHLFHYFQDIKKQATFHHYSYIPISDGIYSRIKAIDDYIVEQQEKVYILDASAVIFKIPLDQYDKYYDLFLKGNLGRNGTEKMIQEIQKQQDAKILIQKSSRNWQTPEDVIEFVQKNKQKTGEIDLFYIYE